MSTNEGAVVNILRKVGGVIATLQKGGVKQIEVDRDGGVQHLNWSDPNLEEILEKEASLVDRFTPTGLRTALPGSAKMIEAEFVQD